MWVLKNSWKFKFNEWMFFWLRQELKKCKCSSVCLSGEKCSRAHNLHLSLSGQSQVSAPPYNPRTRKCMLCTKEAYYINYHRHMATLNKRKEIFGACRHRNMETLSTVCRLFIYLFFHWLQLLTLCYFYKLSLSSTLIIV